LPLIAQWFFFPKIQNSRKIFDSNNRTMFTFSLTSSVSTLLKMITNIICVWFLYFCIMKSDWLLQRYFYNWSFVNWGRNNSLHQKIIFLVLWLWLIVVEYTNDLSFQDKFICHLNNYKFNLFVTILSKIKSESIDFYEFVRRKNVIPYLCYNFAKSIFNFS
jgi:hypothetical protein